MKLWTTLMLIGGSTLLVLSLRAAAKRPRTVLAIGNSLTAHGGYCAALKSQLPEGSEVFCIGYPGEGVKVIRSSLNLQQMRGASDVVVLAGVNDIASGRSLADIKEQLTLLYQDVKASGARLIAVTLTPWASHFNGKQEASRKLTEQINGWIMGSAVPDRKVFTYQLGNKTGKLLPKYDSGDGLHLNDEGQKALGLLIAGQGF